MPLSFMGQIYKLLWDNKKYFRINLEKWNKLYNLCVMATKKKYATDDLKSVKIHKDIVKAVREHKSKSYIPIGKFFEIAATEKLQKEKQSSNN